MGGDSGGDKDGVVHVLRKISHRHISCIKGLNSRVEYEYTDRGVKSKRKENGGQNSAGRSNKDPRRKGSEWEET